MAATNLLPPLQQPSATALPSQNKTSLVADKQGSSFSDALRNASEKTSESKSSSAQTIAGNPQESHGKTNSSAKEKEAADNISEEASCTENPSAQTSAAQFALQNMLKISTSTEKTESSLNIPTQENSEAVEVSSLASTIPTADTSTGAASLAVNTATPVPKTSPTVTDPLSASTSKPAPDDSVTTLTSFTQTSHDGNTASSDGNSRGSENLRNNKNTNLVETSLLGSEKKQETTSTSQTPSFTNELSNAQAAYGLKAEAHANKPSVTQLPVNTPVSSRNWATEVGQRLSWVTHQNDSRAELILTPANMGKIEVSINLNGDQASAAFSAANPAAREALQEALPRLREVLAQAGIQLGEANVNAGTQGQGQAPSQNSTRLTRWSSGQGMESELLPESHSIQRVTRGSSLVDLFA